jgi:hypothetical protein
MHEIGRTNGGRGYQISGNMLQIGRKKIYNQKNEILMKIPEIKRSGIGIFAEFCRIPNGFPNQAQQEIQLINIL